MKIFFEPRVYLIASPRVNWPEVDRFLAEDEQGRSWHRDAPGSEGELLCEFMGRMCYGSFGERQGRKETAAYIANILDHAHGSVLEHANWSFLVTRCTRGYTHQAVRHRAGFSYSQESTHFIEYAPKSTRAALPGAALLPREVILQTCKDVEDAVERYTALIQAINSDFQRNDVSRSQKSKKQACGTARALLPNALESKLGFTANARALRHFLELRGKDDNVIEIRLVAAQVLAIMQREAPAIFGDFEAYVAEDKYVALHSKYRKV